MIINDLIFTIGNFAFFLALSPSIFGNNKPDTKTSAITATVLFSFTLNFLSLGLYLSAATAFASAAAWLILYIQVKKRDKIESNFST